MSTEAEIDKRAPMASAPMKYLPDGSVNWGDMWDTFCVLAKDGGPPHRATMLEPDESSDIKSEGYLIVTQEIIRGIYSVSGLSAKPASPGWIEIACGSAGMARWLSEAIRKENVQTRADGARLYVPTGQSYTLKGEIKNVITAVAKTTHYWQDHIPSDMKAALGFEERLSQVKARIKRLFRMQPA